MRPALHRNLIAVALATVVALLALAPAQTVRADTGYAALLVLFGPDDYHTECIALPGDMTAIDLVRASTLDATIESVVNGADAICSIDGTGCVYPGEACFCQCNADVCALWTEWYWDGHGWEVAFDADERVIADGAVEAWAWGDGMSEPPVVAFDDICTGVGPGDSPEAPTATLPANTAYPAPAGGTPTLWVISTRPAVTAAATAMRTATTFGQPGSQLTLAAGTPTPGATQLATRFATPTWMAPQPTGTAATGALTTPTSEGAAVAAAPAASSGSPTPDQAAMSIDTSVARVRGTALAASSQAAPPRRGSIGTWLLGIAAAVLVAYALLLQRQRRLDAQQVISPPSPQNEGQTGAAMPQGGAEPLPAQATPGEDVGEDPSAL